MTTDSNRDAGPGEEVGQSVSGLRKKPYEAPRILSVETLEAVAAVCDGTGGFGKTVPLCNPQTPGS